MEHLPKLNEEIRKYQSDLGVTIARIIFHKCNLKTHLIYINGNKSKKADFYIKNRTNISIFFNVREAIFKSGEIDVCKGKLTSYNKIGKKIMDNYLFSIKFLPQPLKLKIKVT